ncbi:BQ2448_587 [Microbotryum intermedium]|uniref:BQ2448_587 protein n=1 Tax=Microbotryum intermedium TaxID=269621 RepID=A0A238FBK9_9BASI|nr:BQ2448_587 [Microbotryum intermedium]
MSTSPSPSTSAPVEQANPPSGSSHGRSATSVSPSKRVPLKRQKQEQQQQAQRHKEMLRHDIELLSDSSSGDDERGNETLLQKKRRTSLNTGTSATANSSSARAGPSQAPKARTFKNRPGTTTTKKPDAIPPDSGSDAASEASGSRLSKETFKTKNRRVAGGGKQAGAEQDSDSDVPASKVANAGVESTTSTTVQKNASRQGKRKITGNGDEDEGEDAQSSELSSVDDEVGQAKETEGTSATHQRGSNGKTSSAKSSATTTVHPAQLKSKKSNERLFQDDPEPGSKKKKKKQDNEDEGVDQSAVAAAPIPATMSAKHQKYSTGLALNVASKPPATTTPSAPTLAWKAPAPKSSTALVKQDAPSMSSGSAAVTSKMHGALVQNGPKPGPKQTIAASSRPRDSNVSTRMPETVTPKSTTSAPSKAKAPTSTAFFSKPSEPVTLSTDSSASVTTKVTTNSSSAPGMASSFPKLSQMRRIPKTAPTQQAEQQDSPTERGDQGLASKGRVAGAGKPPATSDRPEITPSRRVSSSDASDFRFTLKEEAITGYSVSGRSKVDDLIDLAEPVVVASRDDAVAFVEFSIARNWFRSKQRLFLRVETTADPEDPRSSMALATIALGEQPPLLLTRSDYFVSASARPASGSLSAEFRRHLTIQGEFAAAMLLVRAILTPHKGFLDVTRLIYSVAHDSSPDQEDEKAFVDRLEKKALTFWHDYKDQHPRHNLVKLMPRFLNLGEKDALLVCDQLINTFEKGCATTADGTGFLGFGSWEGKLGQDLHSCTSSLMQFAEGKPAYWKKVKEVLTRLDRLCVSDGSPTAIRMSLNLKVQSLEAHSFCMLAERRYAQEGKAWPEPRIAHPPPQQTLRRTPGPPQPPSPPTVTHVPSKSATWTAASSLASTSQSSTSTAPPAQSSVGPIAPSHSAVGQGGPASAPASNPEATVPYAPLRPSPFLPPEEKKIISRPAANDPRLAKRNSYEGRASHIPAVSTSTTAAKSSSVLLCQSSPIVAATGPSSTLDAPRHTSPAVIGHASEHVSEDGNSPRGISPAVGKELPARSSSATASVPSPLASDLANTPAFASVALPVPLMRSETAPAAGSSTVGRGPSISETQPGRSLKRLKLMDLPLTSSSDLLRRPLRLTVSEEVELKIGSPLSSTASRGQTPVTELRQTSLPIARRETPVNTPTGTSGSPTAHNARASPIGRTSVAPPRAPPSASVVEVVKEAGSLRPLITGPFYHEVVGHLLEPVGVYLIDTKRMWSKPFVLDDPQILTRLREPNREDTDLSAKELPLRARGVFRRDAAVEGGLEDILWPSDITLSMATGPPGSWERTCPIAVTNIMPGATVEPCHYFDLTPYLALGHNAFIIAKLGSVHFPPGLRFSIEVCTSFSAAHARRQIKEEEDEDKTFELYNEFAERMAHCDSVNLPLADPRAPTKRIDLPVRGVECEHLETFDFETHLASSTKDDWKCPFDHTSLQGSDIGCSKFCPPSKLWICRYTLDNVFKGVPEDAVDVFIEAGASQVKTEEVESPN